MEAEIKDAKKLPSAPHPPQGHQTSLAGGIHKAVPGFITIIKQSLGAGWAFQRPPQLPSMPSPSWKCIILRVQMKRSLEAKHSR